MRLQDPTTHITEEFERRPTDVIRSAANPLIKRVRSLQRRRTRYKERAFVVEGFRAVGDVLDAGIRPECVLFREDAGRSALMDQIDQQSIPWRQVDSSLFDELTDQPHPQGVLAVVPMLDSAEIATDRSKAIEPFYLILDGIRDPGNLGTLLRSAAGAGVDHVYLTPETVDPYNSKVVRAGMGAHFRIRFSQIDALALMDVLSSARIVGLAEADGDVDYDAVDWTDSVAIIVGGEAKGASDLVRDRKPMKVQIPLAAGVESLNAAMAGSLLVFEVARQRRVANRLLS